MTSAASVGTISKLGLGTANPVTQEFEFATFSLAKKPQIIQTDGIRGTRSRPSEQRVPGIIPIDGQWTLTPTVTELAWLLQYILGGTPTGSSPTTYPLAETMPTGLYCTVDRIVKVYTYTGVAVNRAEFSSTEGGPLTLTLDLVALTETVGNAGTFPAISGTLPSDQPFTHQALTLTANAITRNIFEQRCVIDNHLVPRFMNSQTAVSYIALDRTVTLDATTPFTADEIDLFTQALTPGVGGTAAFANPDGTHTLTMTFGALQAAIPTPPVPGREEIKMTIPFQATTLGATKELVITL